MNDSILSIVTIVMGTLKGVVALGMDSQRVDSECVAIRNRLIFYNHRRIVTIETKHTSLMILSIVTNTNQNA